MIEGKTRNNAWLCQILSVIKYISSRNGTNERVMVIQETSIIQCQCNGNCILPTGTSLYVKNVLKCNIIHQKKYQHASSSFSFLIGFKHFKQILSSSDSNCKPRLNEGDQTNIVCFQVQ